MASGPDPANPRSESHVAKTVNTSTNVMTSSMPKVCPTDTPSLGLGVHRLPSFVLFDAVDAVVRPLRTPAPTTAPTVCTTTYSNAL